MTDLPIAPDESTGEPRCVATCPSATPSTCGGVCCSECVDCEVDQVSTEVGLLCLPRVRELVAISRRRCDGCRRYTEDARLYPADGRCVTRGCATMAHDCCSRWEAKP